MAESPRYVWMFAFRGIAILLVVSHHCLQSLIDATGSAPQALQVIDEFLGPFRMPALMFLSGMLLARSMRKPARAFFGGKFSAIGWPYLLWSLLVLAIAGEMTPTNLLKLLYAPPNVYWFLWFLLAFYCLAYATRRVHPAILIGLALPLAVLLPHVIRAPRFFLLFAFFIGGHWAMRHRDRCLAFVRRPGVVAIAIALVVATGTAAALGFPMRYSVASIPGVVAAIGLAATALPRTDTWRAMAPLHYVGARSLVYYVSHWPVVLALTVVFAAIELGDLIALAALLIAGLGVATALCVAKARLSQARVLFEWPRSAVRLA